MSTKRLLPKAIVLSAVVLAVQLALSDRSSDRGLPYLPSWVNNPQTMAEAKDSAEEILLGRVTQIRRAQDLVVAAPGEPGGSDSIPVEVVTIQVERRHKGDPGRPQQIEVFHTGLSRGQAPADQGDQPPGPPPPGARRPRRAPDKSAAASRTVILADDPAYQTGERYVLFLRSGPTVAVGGQQIATQRVLSPEGRYRVRSDDTVEPISTRAAFAREQRGKRLADLEALLR